MRRLAHLLVALCLMAAPALATTDEALPALYDVAGVAADDVLNIRAEPTASAAIIGALGPKARRIEVIQLDASGHWGRVNSGEGTGWVSMAYLARQPGQFDSLGPAITSCFGTEPFWRIAPAPGGWQMTMMGAPLGTAMVLIPADRTGRPDTYAWLAGQGALVIRRALCSDGMSDQLFGLAAELVTPNQGGASLWTGCCSLTR